MNHLTVTWKVDDKLYQHVSKSKGPYQIVDWFFCTSILDIAELDMDLTGKNIRGQLVVDGKYKFSDVCRTNSLSTTFKP
jgi:hypothetical protein